MPKYQCKNCGGTIFYSTDDSISTYEATGDTLRYVKTEAGDGEASFSCANCGDDISPATETISLTF